MKDQPVDNVDKLRHFFEDQGFHIDEIPNGFRIRLDTGHIIEINALIRDSDFLWANFETAKASPEKVQAVIHDIHDTVSKALLGMATIGEFEETQDADDRFLFVADIGILPSVVYHGTVSIEDARTETIPAAQAQKKEEPKPEKPREAKKETPELMPAEQAVSLLESIDGKMLRQSLDMMNLRRSSIVRLALTRIFRSATDPKELIVAIREEAGKITAPEDLQELEMIKILSANGFLAPVVELLWQEVQSKT